MRALLEQWDLIEFDFATILHTDLEANITRSWRWFMVRVSGLLGMASIYDPQTGVLLRPGSLLNAYFARQEDTDG